jgi:hypothetical protein
MSSIYLYQSQDIGINNLIEKSDRLKRDVIKLNKEVEELKKDEIKNFKFLDKKNFHFIGKSNISIYQEETYINKILKKYFNNIKLNDIKEKYKKTKTKYVKYKIEFEINYKNEYNLEKFIKFINKRYFYRVIELSKTQNKIKLKINLYGHKQNK